MGLRGTKQNVIFAANLECASSSHARLNPTKASKLIPSMSNELGSVVATVAVNVEVPADFRLNVP